MKIESFRRFQTGDFPESPPWLAKFLDPLNRILESLVNALSGRLDSENIDREVRRNLELPDNEEFQVSLQKLRGSPIDVRVGLTDFHEFPLPVKWRIIDEKTIAVTVSWRLAPSDTPIGTLIIEGDGG